MEPTKRKQRSHAIRAKFLDHLLGAGIAAVYVGILLATSHELAMNRDEGFYAVAAERYGAWMELAWTNWEHASEPNVIAQYWSYNHEHPGLMKGAFALSLLAHKHLGWFQDATTAIRFPGMLCGGLMLWLLYIFGSRIHGRAAGIAAAFAFATIPRVFYHAHLDCFDIPIAFFLTWTTYAYWRALKNPNWTFLVAIAFGLALATKHNAWILPGVFLIHWIWVVAIELQLRRRRPDNRPSTFTPRTVVPWWLIGIAVLGPPIFVLSWPWLWDHTWSRFVWYVKFHTNHVHYSTMYLGENLTKPPFPVSLPWLLTAFTVPATILAFAGFSIIRRSRSWLPKKLTIGIPTLFIPLSVPDRRRTDVLLIGTMLAPLVVISLPSTPIFGGTKHWIASYAPLALFAGFLFADIFRAIRQRKLASFEGKFCKVKYATALVGFPILCMVPSTLEVVHSHPLGLAHYGFLSSGVAGAADKGMNRQYWGYTHGQVTRWLASHLPDGGRVWPCDATHKSWEMMHESNLLPKNIRLAHHMDQADYILVHHEDHFAEVEFQAWVTTGTVQPAHVLTYEGVPIVSIYAGKSKPSVAPH